MHSHFLEVLLVEIIQVVASVEFKFEFSSLSHFTEFVGQKPIHLYSSTLPSSRGLQTPSWHVSPPLQLPQIPPQPSFPQFLLVQLRIHVIIVKFPKVFPEVGFMLP